jgi:hypothetical protein
MRLLATLGLALWLVGGTSSVPASAQSEGETTQQTVDEETPPSDEGTEPEGNATGESTEEQAAEPVATGTLTVLVYLCTSGGDAGTRAIVPAGEFSPDESCTESTATIAIDGSEPTTVEGTADFALDAGTHTVTDTTTGATLDVEIVGDEVTSVSVVAYAAAEEEAAAAEESQAEEPTPATIYLIKHDCAPEIQTSDDFALLDPIGKLTTCPVITLPTDAGADDTVQGDPAEFDFSFDTGSGDPQTLTGNATFTQDTEPVCESDPGINQDVDGDQVLESCFDASSYAVTVPSGPVTITETTAPDNHRFGAVEVPDADDAAALNVDSVDVTTGQFTVDPSLDTSDGELVIHVYNFSPPRVTVVVHSCPATVEKTADFAAKLENCEAVTLDSNPELGLKVAGTDALEQTIAEASVVEDQVCESDLQVDLDGDTGVDLCLPAYAFDGVAQGSDVKVTETTAPVDHAFGAAEVDPNSGDAVPVKVNAKKGIVTLDTTNDGEVTLHLFNFAIPQDTGGGNSTGGSNSTGGNTGGGGNSTGGGGNAGGGDNSGGDGSGGGNTAGGTGSVAIYMLYCVADSEYTDIQVLNPGDNVDPSSFGDDTCVQDANEFQITEFSSNDLAPFDVGADGFEQLDLPVTEGENPHLITDTWSGTTASFEIASGAVTPIVVLAYESWEAEEEYYEEEYEDEYYEDEYEEYIDDEEAVESGEDLPDTGVTVAPGSSQSQALLLGMTGLLALGGAYGLRRVGSR